MKISDILSISTMNGATVLAGHTGLNKTLKSATVIDAPDAIEWLKSDEMVFTSTYPLRKLADKLDTFIRELHEREVAGLGVKLTRYMTELPETTLQIADDLGFPIISLPSDIAWIDLIKPIVTNFFEDDNRNLAAYDGISSSFTRMLLSNSSLKDIINILYEHLRLPVILNLWADFSELITAPQHVHIPDDGFRDVVKQNCNSEITLADHLQSVRYKAHHISFAPIFLRDKLIGSIIILQGASGTLPQGAESVVSQAKAAITLKLMQSQAELDVKSQQDTEIIRVLLNEKNNLNDTTEIIGRYKDEKIEIFPSYTLVCIAAGKSDVHKGVRLITQKLKQLLKYDRSVFVASLEAERIYLLFPYDADNNLRPEQIRQLMSSLLDTLDQSVVGKWQVGVSQIQRRERLNIARNQALFTLKYAAQSKQSERIIIYDDIGIYRLFSHPEIQGELVEYVRDWLMPLIEYDRTHPYKLTETLKVFLEVSGNYREASRKLNLHHNTIRYRISLIQKLTGRDILEPPMRMQYQLSLMLLDGLSPEEVTL